MQWTNKVYDALVELPEAADTDDALTIRSRVFEAVPSVALIVIKDADGDTATFAASSNRLRQISGHLATVANAIDRATKENA